MKAKTGIGIFLIIIGIIIFLYFIVLGWYIVAGIGGGCIWGGVEILKKKEVNILKENLKIDKNKNLAIVEIEVQNFSNKMAQVCVTISLYCNNCIIATKTSDNLVISPKGKGICSVEFGLRDDVNFNEISYKIVGSNVI